MAALTRGNQPRRQRALRSVDHSFDLPTTEKALLEEDGEFTPPSHTMRVGALLTGFFMRCTDESYRTFPPWGERDESYQPLVLLDNHYPGFYLPFTPGDTTPPPPSGGGDGESGGDTFPPGSGDGDGDGVIDPVIPPGGSGEEGTGDPGGSDGGVIPPGFVNYGALYNWYALEGFLIAPVATAATAVDYDSFSANWDSSTDATGYYLDVSESSTFATFLTGFDNLDVGDVNTYPVPGLSDETTYYYRLRAYSDDKESSNSNVITVTTETVYTACATNQPDFASHSADNSMFLSCGLVTLVTGTIGDYSIEWSEGSTSGTVVFTSGITADTGEVQAQHPFVDEVVFAGTLYPVINYIYIDGVKYVSAYDGVNRYSPDLVSCLDPIIIDAVGCSSTLGTDAIYPYTLAYNNVTDSGQDKSRKIKFDLLNTTGYFAWSFAGFNVPEQVKLYYCTLLDEAGVLLENIIHGVNNIVVTHYPVDYPTNPKVFSSNYGGTANAVCLATDLSDFTYASGDYLRIEIIGSVYDPTITNTNWTIKFKCLSSDIFDAGVDGAFIADSGMNKITSTPTITYDTTGDTCMYKISYTTLDSPFTGFPSRSTSLSNLYKYCSGFTYSYGPSGGNPAGISFASPVVLGLRWYSQGSSYAVHASTSFNTCMNLAAGQSITVTKNTTDITYSFTDINDYNKYVADIATWQINSYYTTWTGLTDSDSRYYGCFRINTVVATTCGDTKTDYYHYFWYGCPIEYDAVNKTIKITYVIPTNNFTDLACDTTYTVVSSSISSMLTTKNATLPGGAVTTYTRYIGTLYCTWPYFNTYHDSSMQLGYGIGIEESLIPQGVDIASLGFCQYTNTSTSKLWVLWKYYDRITLTDTSTPETRLANWRLERRISLRTDVCTDTAYEIVYEESA